MRKTPLFLLAAFLIFSCQTDNMNNETNPFIGTWENELGRWVFTDTTITVYYSNGDIYWSGTYTYDDSSITFTYEYRVPGLEANPNPQTYTYSIEDNSLLLGGLAIGVKVSNNG